MNVREYFERHFPNHDLSGDGGAGDGCSEGDILAEVPLDSPCGADCKTVIDAAVLMSDRVRAAFGDDMRPHNRNILDAAVDVICCFIRG
jgi:hypothetical protein